MRRSAIALVFTVCVAVPTILPTPADAQLDVEDLSDEEAEILEEQSRLDEIIVEAGLDVATAHDEILRLEIEGELALRDLAAAQYERTATVESRRALAVQQYVTGDPRIEGFIDELVQERASVGPAIERALYAQILDRNTASIDRYDELIDDFGEHFDDLENRLEDRRGELPGLEQAYDTAVSNREATDATLAAIQLELDWERSLLRRARLTGLDDGTDNTRPVLAVKIDNVSAARPQAGINQADVVIEELVEGDLTRLVGLFHSTESDPLGPIRSVRTSDVLILANLNRPLLGNSGGNPGVMAALNESPIVDVGATVAPGSAYFRNNSRSAPNNLFSSTATLWGLGAGSEAGAAPPLFSFRRPDRPPPAGAQPTSGADIDYGATRVSYRWDADIGGWRRTQDGSPHLDTAGVQVAPTNVIVQVVGYHPSVVASISPEAEVVGEGEVWVFQNGTVQVGTWSRESLESPTRYVDADGEEIELLPGRTWIALAPPGTATLVG
ncbi:MAG: DUF3048 domain-containing protein [Acidimicrobiia bacterium]|nr:DUF3048 domain-containing protein [Acidimicrobiia bacterium]